MEDDNRKRKPKKPENPVREWISDNLRYIMLIGGIIIAVIVTFFVVRAVTGGGSDGNKPSEPKSAVTSHTSETHGATPSAAPTETQSQSDTSAATGTPTQTPAPSETSSPAETPAPAAAEPTQNSDSLTAANSDVSSVVTTYFNALAAKDADAAASVLESISDEDRTAVSEGRYGNSYSDISVYSYPGDTDGAYVVLARYKYTYPGYSTALPALTQLYVMPRADGTLCIASEATQQSKAEYMASVMQMDDATALVSEVQAEYDAALASDPALAEYVSGIRG